MLQWTNIQRLFFVDVSGGTGQKFMISALKLYFKSKVLKVQTTAYSADAIQLLDRDRTDQSALKIPISGPRSEHCSIDLYSALLDELGGKSFVTCEDIIMTHRRNLKAVY